MPIPKYEKYSDADDYLLFVKRVVKENRIVKDILKYQSFHNAIEIVFGVKGSSELYIGSEKHSLTEGKMILINSFESHRFNFIAGSEIYIVLISPTFFNNENRLKMLCIPKDAPINPNFDKIVSFLDFAYNLPDKESSTFKYGFVNMLVSVLTAYYPHNYDYKLSKHNEVLMNVMKYISEHFKEDIDVKSIAAKIGYSANYLSSLFIKYMGIGIREQINRLRIMEFIQMKEKAPDVPICSLAELCGFTNMATFYNALNKFKAEERHIDKFNEFSKKS